MSNRKINTYIKPNQENVDPQCIQELIDILNGHVKQEQIEDIIKEYGVEYRLIKTKCCIKE